MTNILDSFRLDHKIALVTGSASGLGAAIATALAQAGATVACHGNRRAATATAEAIGGKAAAFQADLSSIKGAEELFEQVKAKFGHVDILVNNAGTIARAAAEDVTLEDWQQVLQVNLTSVFQLSQLAARDMIPRGGGKIVNIASLLSFQGGIRVPAYTASKGGVAQLTKALANEWAPKGIQVNAIAPGYLPPLTPKRYRRTRPAIAKYWSAFRPAAGDSRRILLGQRCFSARRRAIM
jgi:2-deoxy-D-gluconate 3-dehydrogenase